MHPILTHETNGPTRSQHTDAARCSEQDPELAGSDSDEGQLEGAYATSSPANNAPDIESTAAVAGMFHEGPGDDQWHQSDDSEGNGMSKKREQAVKLITLNQRLTQNSFMVLEESYIAITIVV